MFSNLFFGKETRIEKLILFFSRINLYRTQLQIGFSFLLFGISDSAIELLHCHCSFCFRKCGFINLEVYYEKDFIYVDGLYGGTECLC